MLGFLTSKVINYILGGSLVAMAIALGTVTISKNATIHELRGQVAAVAKERDTATKNLGTCRANQSQLEISIADQNREISRMVASGETRQKLVDSLREDADAKRRTLNILTRKGETAEDADKLILELTR